MVRCATSLSKSCLPISSCNQIVDIMSHSSAVPGDWQIHKGVAVEGGRMKTDLFMIRQATHCPMCCRDRDGSFAPGCAGAQFGR